MGVFNGNNGDTSSKRVIGSIIIFWALFMSSYYIFNIQFGGKESMTTENLLMSALGSGVVMITGGVLDGLFNKRSEIKNIKTEKNGVKE